MRKFILLVNNEGKANYYILLLHSLNIIKSVTLAIVTQVNGFLSEIYYVDRFAKKIHSLEIGGTNLN